MRLLLAVFFTFLIINSQAGYSEVLVTVSSDEARLYNFYLGCAENLDGRYYDSFSAAARALNAEIMGCEGFRVDVDETSGRYTEVTTSCVYDSVPDGEWYIRPTIISDEFPNGYLTNYNDGGNISILDPRIDDLILPGATAYYHNKAYISFFQSSGEPLHIHSVCIRWGRFTDGNNINIADVGDVCEADETINTDGSCSPVCDCDEDYDSVIESCISNTPFTTYDYSLQTFYTYAQNANGDQCTVDATEYENSCSNSSSSTETNHPIDCATGQKKYSEVDYTGFGLNPITYSRYYETPDLSEYDDDGVIYSSISIGSGSYWDSNSVPSLTTITFEDGAYAKVFSIGKKIRRIFFYAAGSTSYTTNPNFDGILLAEENGFTVVTLASGYRYAFNATGTVANVTDDEGDAEYIYTWDDSTGINLLSRVANRFGRYLDYTYNTDGLLITLTDQDGVSVHYEYDTNQNLTKVIYPDGTPTDLTDNPSKEYLFENTDFPSYVTGIVDQDGIRLATIEYNDDGKAFSSELADGTDRVEVTYPTDSTSIVKFYRDVDADAYREEQYTFDKFRGQYKLTSKDITLCDNCELTTETWSYNSQQLLERHTSPAGTITEYGYDDEYRSISESIGVGTPEVRTTTYTWNDTHNQIETITTATDITTYTFDVDGNKTNTLITPVQ